MEGLGGDMDDDEYDDVDDNDEDELSTLVSLWWVDESDILAGEGFLSNQEFKFVDSISTCTNAIESPIFFNGFGTRLSIVQGRIFTSYEKRCASHIFLSIFSLPPPVIITP
jgi:hypothetical protein